MPKYDFNKVALVSQTFYLKECSFDYLLLVARNALGINEQLFSC